MNLDRIRYFLVLVETEHVGRAASLLGITPAALSKSMAKLQEELKLPLLRHEGRGIVVTPEGRRFVDEIKPRVLELEGSLKALRAGKASAEDRPFRLGTFEVFSSYVLGRLVAEEFRDLAVDVHELVPGPLEEALARGQIDVGLSYIPVPHPKVQFLKVGRVRMGVYALKGFAGKAPFEEWPFVVPLPPVDGGSATKVTGLDGWPDHERPRRIVYRVDLMESAFSLLREGLAVAYLPELVVRFQNRVVAPEFRLHEIGEGLLSERARSQDVYLVLRKGEAETRPSKRIARFLRKVMS